MHVLYNYLIPILSILGLPLDRRSIDIALFRGTCVISANKGNREYGVVGLGWVGGSTSRKRDILASMSEVYDTSIYGPISVRIFLSCHFIGLWVTSFFLGLLEFIVGCCLFGLNVHLLRSDEIYGVYGIF